MVVLETAAFIVGIGFLAWILGIVFDFPGIAAIGCMFVLGVGAMATTGGVQYAAGQEVDTTTTESVVAIDDIADAEHIQPKDVTDQDSNPTGVEFNTDGDKMYISGASSAAIYSYDTGDHDLSIATSANSFSTSTEDSTPSGVEFRPDGSAMYVTGDATDTIYQYSLSTDFDITSASTDGSFDVSSNTTAPRAVDFNGDGTVMYLVGSDNGDIHSYDLSTPYDVTTATHTDQFSVMSQEATPTGIDFNGDGSRMLIYGEDQDTVFEYTLDTPYSLSSAQYNGNNLDTSNWVNRGSGLAYEDSGREIFVTDRNGGTVEQFDAATTETDTVTTKTTTYDDVDTPQQFSLGIFLMLIGGVGIMRIFERMSFL